MQSFLEITLTNIVMATLLALVAAAAGAVWRRPLLSHFLWLLVLLKLITPPLIPVRLCLPASLEAAFAARDSTGANARNTTSPAPPVMDPLLAWRRAGDEIPAEDFIAPELLETNPYRSATVPADAATDLPGEVWTWTLRDVMIWASVIWAGGSLVWIGLAVSRMLRFHRVLLYAQPAPGRLQNQAAELAQRMGLAGCPGVYLVPGRISPLLWPLGRSVRLVLPEELLSRLAPEQQLTLVAHELAHARRRDHWVRWLELVVTGLYWWLPIAWWARRQLQQAEEECCDAWVVWLLPAAAKAYAKALLQTVDFLDARPALPPMASGLGHLYLLRRRLTMIAHKRFSPRLPWPVHVGAVLLGLSVLSIAPQRLPAESPVGDTPVAATFKDDDDPPARSESQTQLRNLERRMSRLEERLDRVLRSLEGGSERGRAEADRNRDPSREERQRGTEERRAADAQRRAAEAERRAMEQQKRAVDRAAEARKRLAERRRGLEWTPEDQERVKALEKQIQDLVNKTFSPERMKDLEKQIQGLVEKNIDPERMKNLDKQIQKLVEKTVNPERMQALQKQIEALVERNLATQQRERGRLPEAPRRPEPPTAPRNVERPRTPETPSPVAAPPRAPTAPRTGSPRDVERRLDQLEEKMDRLLQVLEARQKSDREKK